MDASRPLIAGLAGAIVGLSPALVENLQSDWETVAMLSAGGATLQAFQDNLAALSRVGAVTGSTTGN